MNKYLKYGLGGIVALLVILQFIPVEMSNPPVTSEMPVNSEVKTVLKRACYDCHSNETVWPWYSKIAPVSFLVAYDVNDGRKHLNFSTWGEYKAKKKNHKLEELVEEVESDAMPMDAYVFMHPETALSAEEKAMLISWAEGQIKPQEAEHDQSNSESHSRSDESQEESHSESGESHEDH